MDWNSVVPERLQFSAGETPGTTKVEATMTVGFDPNLARRPLRMQIEMEWDGNDAMQMTAHDLIEMICRQLVRDLGAALAASPPPPPIPGAA